MYVKITYIDKVTYTLYVYKVLVENWEKIGKVEENVHIHRVEQRS